MKDRSSGARRTIAALGGCLILQALAGNCFGFAVTSTVPENAALDVPADTSVSAEFSCAIQTAFVHESSFKVWGEQTGFYPGSFTFDPVTFQADEPFKPGELVSVLVTENIPIGPPFQLPITPSVIQFHVVADGCNGFGFTNDTVPLSLDSSDVALGDLDGDGFVDAYVAVGADGTANTDYIFINQGDGSFAAVFQTLGPEASTGVALGDLDSDGDLDAFVTGLGGSSGETRAYFRQGDGTYNASLIGDFQFAMDVALGDLNGDGHLDAFIAAIGDDVVLFNQGNGSFVVSETFGNTFGSVDVALGDINGDDHLDAFVPAFQFFDRVWTNDGDGLFQSSDASLGNGLDSRAVAMCDLDDDGDLDAYIAKRVSADVVYHNNGSGGFTLQQSLTAGASSEDVALGDLDGDGDLDALVASWTNSADVVYLNDGNGAFTTNQTLTSRSSTGAALADLDGDGDLDGIVTSEDSGLSGRDLVYLNAGCADLMVEKTASVSNLTTSSNFTYTITVSNPGLDQAEGVTLTDYLPPGISPGGTAVYNIGEIPGGSNITIQFSVTVHENTIGTLTNRAVAAADNDLNYGNNTGEVETLIVDTDHDSLPDFIDLDDDGDTMPDEWESAHGLNAADPSDALGNLDGDTLLNLEEYITDTDPEDSNSFFQATGITISSPVEISFDSSTGRIYTLEAAASPSVDNWNAVPGQIDIPGIGGQTTLTDTENLSERKYRILVELP